MLRINLLKRTLRWQTRQTRRDLDRHICLFTLLAEFFNSPPMNRRTGFWIDYALCGTFDGGTQLDYRGVKPGFLAEQRMSGPQQFGETVEEYLARRATEAETNAVTDAAEGL